MSREQPVVLLAGLSTVDIVQRVPELPAPGEKVRSLAVEITAGGPAANAAVTVAALGGVARLLTVLGTHPLARMAAADLAAHGVRIVDALPDGGQPPPVSAVTVRDRDGERTVVSRNAAATAEGSASGPDRFDPRLPEPGDQVGAVLVDGHHPSLALAAAQWAKASGVPVVLDAGSWKPVLEDLLPLVDVAACAAGFRVPQGTPSLAERGVPAVVVTDGAEPVRWRAGDRSGSVEVPPVSPRDTLGAGDVWHGAFAFALARWGGAELYGLIRFANEIAAERVRHAGPRSWLPAVRARGERDDVVR